MYYYVPPFCFVPFYRQYPPVNPDLFHQSAIESKKLLNDANTFLNAVSELQDFDKTLMEAAQASETKKVNELISSIGIHSDVDMTYNPDGMRIHFRSKVSNIDCCIVTISLRWR